MADCNGIDDSCKGEVGPDFDLETPSSRPGCAPQLVEGRSNITATEEKCSRFDLQDNGGNDYIEDTVEDALNIAGAKLNVYKMLGVHEQSKLVDCTGRGQAISNGDAPYFPADNAFDIYITEWRSVQRGEAVTASSYLGYDFGNIKTNDGSRNAYGIETSIFKHIASIAIKQSSNPSRRVTKARIERSDDGVKWYGVSIVTFPDDDCLNTIHFKDSVPSRYWRVRPMEFNGADTGDVWGVQALQMFHNYVATDITNIQDKVFMENRDRDYSEDPIEVKGYYDIVDNIIDLTEFAGELGGLKMYITVSFASCVKRLGRPMVVGDILEIPSEAMYSANLEKIPRWMEITDVAWSTEGYTPGWRPTLLRLIAEVAYASQETQNIFGDLAQNNVDELGLVEGEDGNSTIYQDFFDASQTIEAEARDAVPQRGAEGSSTIRQFEPDEIEEADSHGVNIQAIGLNPQGIYVEDAMPPNNAPYTEDEVFPSNPNHGDYHRMIYLGLSKDIPARLYRYSETKGRWIFLEKDRRSEYNPVKPVIDEFKKSTGATDEDSVTQDRERIGDDCEES